MAGLGVNIDHVATIRQARGGVEPEPVWAAAAAELAGADCITLHLREDRRHIQDRDLELLRQTVQVKLNLEMAATDEMVGIAGRVHPEQSTLVPEKREELTTEGGLDVAGSEEHIKQAVSSLKSAGIEVSLFIDADEKQIEASSRVGADAIELHTGQYANAARGEEQLKRLAELRAGAEQAHSLGLTVHAGHGLNYVNVVPVARLPHVCELNIGHSIIARAVFVGLDRAVKEMKGLIS